MNSENKFSDILRMDEHFSQKFGIQFLRTEAKLIFLLKEHESLSIKEAMTFLNCSYRGFYIILNKLRETGIIYISNDEGDKRVRKITLQSYDIL